MTALKYSAATLALLFASGMAYAQDSITVQPQPGAATSIECPAPGSVPEADLKPECKPGMSTSEAPKVEGDATGTAEAPKATTEMPKVEGDATGTAEAPKATTEMPKAESDAAATGTVEAPKATTEIPKTETDSIATGTTKLPKQDDTAAVTGTTMATDSALAVINPATAVLASQFMGMTVYSTGNDNVGEINDLVMSKDLDTVVAIIGVGGFLGMGEKDVAIPVGDITATKDENNKLRLTIAATKEELEAAPVFDRTVMK
jgi:sporulation protein YlmC with PRC-barrel domain